MIVSSEHWSWNKMNFIFILLLSVVLIAAQIQHAKADLCPSNEFRQKHLCPATVCSSEAGIIKRARDTYTIHRNSGNRPPETLFVPNPGSTWREFRNTDLNKVVCEYVEPVTCYKVTKDRKGNFHCTKGRGNANHIKSDSQGGHLNHHLAGTCDGAEACP